MSSESYGDDRLAQDFVRAFDKQRTTLAGFARCSNRDELSIVRDGFYLGLAKDLCPDHYKRVLVMVVRRNLGGTNDTGIAHGEDHGVLSLSAEEMVRAARACDDDEHESNPEPATKNASHKEPSATTIAPTTTDRKTTYWKDLLEAVHATAENVGSDLEGIWKTLEDGRMNWLAAVSNAHPIKVLLQNALAENESTEGDTTDAMMVWIYSICVTLSETSPTLRTAVEDWMVAVDMPEKTNPLKGYREELWDPRRDEWRPLDLGAQAAAEAGGANLLEAWKAR